ncbi:hypothetical protein NQT74_08450 [Alteromonas stellipolaris]|uniref:hypothetical protein n=1 Tax=Alteromonas stellipolaris TaxID=233316 RepID=UPI0021192070|nr:hypothetical protein [Alteromonas stellipolaris]MCQ8848606.1 hypothetical protein [Alteromonas stellipolaris]
MLPGTLLALLGITLAGYIFSSTFIHTKYRLAKFQGHHLLYKCLFVGGIFYLLSVILFYVSWPLTSKGSWLFEIVQTVFPQLNQRQFNVSIVILDTIVLAITAARLFNFLISIAVNFLINNAKKTESHNSSELAINNSTAKSASTQRIKTREETDKWYDINVYADCTDDNYIAHIMNCFLRPSLLLLTLESRRCYVCIPYEFKTPNDHQESQNITIIPVCTGYRDEADLCLELTTDYHEIINILKCTKEDIDKLTPSKRKEKMNTIFNYRVTIPHGQIVSISSFDLAKYRSFKEAENKRRSDILVGRKGEGPQDERVVN